MSQPIILASVSQQQKTIVRLFLFFKCGRILASSWIFSLQDCFIIDIDWSYLRFSIFSASPIWDSWGFFYSKFIARILGECRHRMIWDHLWGFWMDGWVGKEGVLVVGGIFFPSSMGILMILLIVGIIWDSHTRDQISWESWSILEDLIMPWLRIRQKSGNPSLRARIARIAAVKTTSTLI